MMTWVGPTEETQINVFNREIGLWQLTKITVLSYYSNINSHFFFDVWQIKQSISGKKNEHING